MFVEGPESPGPAARHVHPADQGVLAADMAHEVDGTVEQYPPVIRVLALAEQLDAGLDANLGTALSQLRQLGAGQAVKDAERAKLVGVHQIMAVWRCSKQMTGSLMAQPPAGRASLPGEGRRAE